MNEYKVPLRDMHFALYDVLDYEKHYRNTPNCSDATPDVVQAILEENARFCEGVLAPLNRVGDREGCRWNDGEVTTPTGFKEAYQQYVEAGWPSMTHSGEYGGQGLPASLGIVLSEAVGSANWAWSMYPGLSNGAVETITAHGSQEQKQTFLSKLIKGEWTGTMCLTEPHCGSDLGILRTRAEPNDDGSYRISGTKIFISAGNHDMAENIVHIVLARLPDAPAGTKGISLFIVPKFLPGEDGGVGERNGVNCGSIEHKMGIHGNATCVLNFDQAKGFLIGPPNRGLNCMFTFMNGARLGAATQGVVHAEVGFQKSLDYARERLQMRALSGPQNPQGAADPIIVHPDVRRMLLTQKAFAEGGRLLIYYAAKLVDTFANGNEQDAAAADELLSLLTPIAKGFLTEVGFESANLGLQCFGGHGFIQEWGMEQNVRDCRISMLYEGTTGIQGLDLLARKVLKTKGDQLHRFTDIVEEFCRSQAGHETMVQFIGPLAEHIRKWHELTAYIGAAAEHNPDEIGAASVDYLMYSGYVTLGYFWALAAAASQAKLAQGIDDADFYEAKLHTARFYFERILPRTASIVQTITSGAGNLMALGEGRFAF